MTLLEGTDGRLTSLTGVQKRTRAIHELGTRETVRTEGTRGSSVNPQDSRRAAGALAQSAVNCNYYSRDLLAKQYPVARHTHTHTFFLFFFLSFFLLCEIFTTFVRKIFTASRTVLLFQKMLYKFLSFFYCFISEYFNEIFKKRTE